MESKKHILVILHKHKLSMLRFSHDCQISRLLQFQLQPGRAAALAPSCGVRLQVLVWNSFSLVWNSFLQHPPSPLPNSTTDTSS